MNNNIIQIDSLNPDPVIIRHASDILIKGGLVIFPTETVYGIGAIYTNTDAEDKLFMAKCRDRNKPITIHISNIDIIKKCGCEIPDYARQWIHNYWPGPITLLLPMSTGKGKLGFRLPAHSVALALIDASGGAVLASSANRSGLKSPHTAEDAFKQLGDVVDIILDAGPTSFLGDSTILDCSDEKMDVIRCGVAYRDKIGSK